jgi:hypothetical protein
VEWVDRAVLVGGPGFIDERAAATIDSLIAERLFQKRFTAEKLLVGGRAQGTALADADAGKPISAGGEQPHPPQTSGRVFRHRPRQLLYSRWMAA